MDLHNNAVGYDIGAKAMGASDRHLAVRRRAGETVRIESLDCDLPVDEIYLDPLAAD